MATKKTNTTPAEPVEAPVVEEVKTEPKPKKAEPKIVKAKVVAECGLNLRQEESTESPVIEIIAFDTEVTVDGDKKAEWVKVTTPNGNSGFVMTQFLKF